jgi:hypothetical protein
MADEDLGTKEARKVEVVDAAVPDEYDMAEEYCSELEGIATNTSSTSIAEGSNPWEDISSSLLEKFDKRHSCVKASKLFQHEYRMTLDLKLPGALDFSILANGVTKHQALLGMVSSGAGFLHGFYDEMNSLQRLWIETTLPLTCVVDVHHCLPEESQRIVSKMHTFFQVAQDAHDAKLEAKASQASTIPEKNDIRCGLGKLPIEEVTGLFEELDLIEIGRGLPDNFAKALNKTGDIGITWAQFLRLFKQSRRKLEFVIVKELEKIYRTKGDRYLINKNWFLHWKAHLTADINWDGPAEYVEYMVPKKLNNAALEEKIIKNPEKLKEIIAHALRKTDEVRADLYHTVSRQTYEALQSIHGGGPPIALSSKSNSRRTTMSAISECICDTPIPWKAHGFVICKNSATPSGWKLRANLKGELSVFDDPTSFDDNAQCVGK